MPKFNRFPNKCDEETYDRAVQKMFDLITNGLDIDIKEILEKIEQKFGVDGMDLLNMLDDVFEGIKDTAFNDYHREWRIRKHHTIPREDFEFAKEFHRKHRR